MECSLDELVGISNPKCKLDELAIDIDTEEIVDPLEDLKNKINILNNLIDKNRRTFEDLSKSQKRSSHLINELTIAKKRNDLIFKELQRTVNRLSKTEELFKSVSSEILSLIDKDLL